MTAAPSAGQLAFLGRSSGQAAGHSALSTKYLRGLVDQLSGCLSALAPQAQRVLVLRAGIGVGRSYTPSQVASLLHVTMAYEGRVQRAAVTALQTAARDGTCGAAQGSIPVSALPVAQGELVTIAGPQPGTAEFMSAAEVFAASHSNLPAGREARSPRSSRTAAAGIPSKANPPIQKAELSRSSTPVGVWTFGVLALLAVLATLFVARRRFGHGQPAPAANAVPPAATALPPAANAVPPAATALPPAATAVPPAATAVPPAATAVAPDDVSLDSQPAPATTWVPPGALSPLPPTGAARGATPRPEVWLPSSWSPAEASKPPAASDAPPAADRHDPPTTTTPGPHPGRPSWPASHRSGVLATLMAASGTLRMFIRARRPRRRLR